MAGPNYNARLAGFVAGDDVSVEATIEDVPEGRTIEGAWLTVKYSPTDDDPGLVQKYVTAVATDSGQILDAGESGTGAALFELTPQESRTMVGEEKTFDVQVLLSGGKIKTPIKGTAHAEDDVTKAEGA